MMTKQMTLMACLVALLWVGGTARAESGGSPEAVVTEEAASAVEADAMANEAGDTPAAAEEEGLSATEAKENPMIEIVTSKGTITVELWADKAPKTVENFIKYAESQFFDGTIFHRVIKNFMIQGGGFTPDMTQKSTQAPVVNEARADVPNARGTLAMARTSVVDSATSQFFINLVDNTFLNHRDRSAQGFGYCVFGKVSAGMDVVDAIAAVSTGNRGGHGDVPTEAVVIESVRVLK